MHLTRVGTEAVGRCVRRVSDLYDYIHLITDIYSAAQIAKDNWLPDTQKKYFIVTVINVLHGDVDPHSENAVLRYENYLKVKRSKLQISKYIGYIADKDWIRYDKEKREVRIPAIYHNIRPGEDIFNFDLTLFYEQIDRLDSDGIEQ